MKRELGVLLGCSLFTSCAAQKPLPATSSAEETETVATEEAPAPGGCRTLSARFAGTKREASKTSVGHGAVEEAASLDLVLSGLPGDAEMKTQIGRDDGPTSKRRDAEQRNVHVARAFLIATYVEADCDFHLIVGTEPNADRPHLMNVEVSGLPRDAASPDMAVLTAARRQFADVVGGELPSGAHKVLSQAIPISVTGSLFFDVDHPAGRVGVGAFKPMTAWEIHPVTNIERVP